MASPVPDPCKPSEVTHAWLGHALTTHESRTSPGTAVHVTDYQINQLAEPGSNFGSEVVKIRVDGSVTPPQGAPPFARRYDLFVKFLLGDEYNRAFVKHSLGDLKELLVYSDVIKDLNAYQEKVTGGKYPITIPGYVYGICTDDNWVLVMEDVSTRGYRTLDKVAGLDLHHVLLVVDNLARVHAVSHAFNQTHDFFQKYPAFRNNYMQDFSSSIVAAAYDGALRLAQQRGQNFNPLVVKMKKNKDAIFVNLRHLYSVPGMGKILCLTHGDCWTNNLMFLPGEEGPGTVSPGPGDLMFIDWGLVKWSNPVFDLHYLVHGSTTLDIRKAHLREILCRYHDTFTAATHDLGAPVPDWGLEDLLNEWRRTAVYGFLFGILLNTFIPSRKAKESSLRGSVGSGWVSRVKTAHAKLMAPIMFSPRSAPFVTFVMRKSMEPIFTELLSGENHTMTTRVLDILMEAFENGVLDP